MPGFGKSGTSRISFSGGRSRASGLNVEGIVLLHGSLLFFNASDVGKAWAGPQAAGEICQLLGSCDGVDLDAAGVQIARVAAHAELRRRALGEITEPHTLNAATDEEAFGREFC